MRFAALDGWRGIFAISVALLHFEGYSHLYGPIFFMNGGLLVDFFFVLSGFVLTHVYAGKLAGAGEFRDFALRRVGRLWPLHVATLLACLVQEAIRSGATLFGYPADSLPFSAPAFHIWALVRSLLLIQALGFDKSETLNLPSWSISVEMYVYFLFGAFCLIASRNRTRIALMLVIGAALAMALLTGGSLTADPFRYGIFRCVYGFFAGYLVYRLRAHFRTPASVMAAAEGPILLLAVAFLYLSGQGALTMAAPLIFGALIYVFSAEAGPLSDLLTSRWFQAAGRWSFSIYMVHMPILRLLTQSSRAVAKGLHTPLMTTVPLGDTIVTLWSFGGIWGTDLALAVYLGLVIWVASITYRTIELPGQRLFNAMIGHRDKPAPPIARTPQPG